MDKTSPLHGWLTDDDDCCFSFHHQQHLKQTFVRVVIAACHSWFIFLRGFINKNTYMHNCDCYKGALFINEFSLLIASWFGNFSDRESASTDSVGRYAAHDLLHLLKVLQSVNSWCRLKNWTDPENQSLVLMLNTDAPEEHAQWRLCIFVLTK